MKAGNGFCTWRTLVGAATVGALAFAVSVQGSPRVGAGERDAAKKSDASRVVRGPSANINSAIAQGGGATITLQPVAPKTVPATTYPAGSTIVGQTLTLTATPARVWFELLGTGWPATPGLKTIQGKISATDPEMDGGGYLGANAVCGGAPAVGAGDLARAFLPCAANVDCRANFSGLAAPCGSGEPSVCLTQAAQCSGGGTCVANVCVGGTNAGAECLICAAGFQDKCDAEYVGSGNPVTAAVDISTPNYRYGATTEPFSPMTDFGPSYFGTLVIDVPANAKGTYTIDFVELETFMQDDTPGGSLEIPVVMHPGVLDIPCGSCCFGIGGAAPGCVDGVSKSECDARPQVSIFDAGGACLNPPTDDGCCACLVDSDCNDGDACTTDRCSGCVCSNTPNASWNQATECCNSASGVETTLGCADQCEAASCTLPGNHGSAQCTATPGAACNDDNPCTYADTCAGGAASCAGLDANSVVCVDSADCAAATGVGYPCIDGFCNCTLTPDLDIEIVDLGGDDNCFDAGEKVTACAHVAASSSPVNGGQFLIGYDPTCLDYLGTIEVFPYTNLVYGPVVDEGAGTIFVAVGVEFGAGNGPNGNADLVCFSFAKAGECNSCNVCPLNNNPMNTYLTDDAGQRITVQANCSKDIFGDAVLTLVTPDNIKTNVDCDRPTAVETWDAPSATDSCGNAVVYCRGEHESGLIYDSATATGGGEFPIGASSFCCYAVSDGPCGTTVGCPPETNCGDADEDGKPDGCWTVQVNDETSLDITIGLSPAANSKPGDNLTRCIKFTLFSNCIQEPLVFSDDVTFGGLFEFVGKSTGKIKIPGSGQWDCITAQDQLHTLRACYTFDGANDCVNGQLNASFSGDPILGGNWLIGGNLDGWKKDDPNANPSLDVIDILDYGTFVSQYLAVYPSTDTPCGTPGPNADINGDGVVDLDDYAFVSMNFLTSSKQCCCGPQTASVNAVTEISVAQLREMGLADLTVADLDGNGLLNLADMAAFDQGVRPTKKAPTKGGSRSTGSR